MAAVQFRGDRKSRLERLKSLCDLARRTPPGTELIVCPELAVTGYVFQTRAGAAAVAEPADGLTVTALAAVAKDKRAWVVCGFVEAAADRLFNSAVVLDPAGERRFVYRKTLLYELDAIWATPGDSGYARFETEHGDFGVGICMDLNDFRFVDWLREAGPRAVAFPTNWVDEGEPVWPYWAGRLHGVGTALIAANTWGTEADVRFSGRSAILQPRDDGPGWWALAAAEQEGDTVIAARLRATSRAEEDG